MLELRYNRFPIFPRLSFFLANTLFDSLLLFSPSFLTSFGKQVGPHGFLRPEVCEIRDRRAAILVDSPASTMIELGDVLVVFGRKEDIEGMLQAEE
jgi:hypothetical protein